MFWQKYCLVLEQKLPNKADSKMCNGGMVSKDTQIKSVTFVPRGCLKYTVYYNNKLERRQ
jgi:hypothetical protein